MTCNAVHAAAGVSARSMSAPFSKSSLYVPTCLAERDRRFRFYDEVNRAFMGAVLGSGNLRLALEKWIIKNFAAGAHEA